MQTTTSSNSSSSTTTTQGQEEYKTIELYGGACQIAIPQRFIDVSNMRQVPDHQEVFACGAHTDQSIIVEIVEMSPDVSDDDIAAYHFNELAQVNQSIQHTVQHRETVADQVMPQFMNLYKSFCVGEQHVSKFREAARNVVNVYLFVLRLPSHETEILITLNDPVFIDPESSSAKDAQAVGQDVHGSMHMFRQVIQSFKIVDYGLFGGTS